MSSHEATPVSAVDELRDELPADLDAMGGISEYEFPDNSRRRIPGAIYLILAAACAIAYFARPDSVLVNGGIGWAAVLLGAAGLISISSGWRMRVDEKQALVIAQRALAFPVGHASAQQVWHGIRSRPTWRVLVYSPEEPPTQRGLALVDAVNGEVIEFLTEHNPEQNPEQWSDLTPRSSTGPTIESADVPSASDNETRA